jgi:hypothetical protein
LFCWRDGRQGILSDPVASLPTWQRTPSINAAGPILS